MVGFQLDFFCEGRISFPQIFICSCEYCLTILIIPLFGKRRHNDLFDEELNLIYILLGVVHCKLRIKIKTIT